MKLKLRTMNKSKYSVGADEQRTATFFLLPTIIMLLLLIAYPMLNNFRISFFDIPINPNLPAKFKGLSHYIGTLTDVSFYTSLGITVLYTVLVVGFSTIIGLGIAIMFNRDFKFKRLARSLIVLSYVTPAISLIFGWRYMLNVSYGIINYWIVDVLHLTDKAPLWFDNPTLAFIMVTVFAIWRCFPYAFISFLAILQSIDDTLYEAADIDGANAWQKFKVVTLPAIRPVLITVITLRTIWTFYMFNDVYLLTSEVNVIGVYVYKEAFSQNNLGQAAAISIILFVILFIVIIMTRKKLEGNTNDA